MITLTGVPTLYTDRLRLRAPEPRDAPAWTAFITSDRAKHVGGPLGPRRAWGAFVEQFGHWIVRGFGNWAVERRDDGRFLGLIGCWRPEPWPENELGWTLVSEAEGHGYAFEAATAARACAYTDFGWTTAVSYIAPGNARSIALAQRLGCVRDPDARDPYDEGELVYRHPAPDQLPHPAPEALP